MPRKSLWFVCHPPHAIDNPFFVLRVRKRPSPYLTKKSFESEYAEIEALSLSHRSQLGRTIPPVTKRAKRTPPYEAWRLEKQHRSWSPL